MPCDASPPRMGIGLVSLCTNRLLLSIVVAVNASRDVIVLGFVRQVSGLNAETWVWFGRDR